MLIEDYKMLVTLYNELYYCTSIFEKLKYEIGIFCCNSGISYNFVKDDILENEIDEDVSLAFCKTKLEYLKCLLESLSNKFNYIKMNNEYFKISSLFEDEEGVLYYDKELRKMRYILDIKRKIIADKLYDC